MLAVVFGCEHFHTNVYGTRFTVESDHKPLEMIHLKNLAAASQRLQLTLLRIQPYDIQLRYRSSKELALADTMSRQPCADGKKIELDVQITFVQFSTHKRQTLRLETRADASLHSLMTVITNGWPKRQRLLPNPLRPYSSYRDELAVEDGLVLKGDRIVIHLSIQAETLTKLHESHQGIEKTCLRSRMCVYWNTYKP